jgi:hypothetical protein
MDPERETLERHIAEVKRSLAARLDLLGGRVNRARRVLEVRSQIRDHLGGALGASAAVGFWLGRRASRRRLLPGRVEVVGHQRGIVGSVVESLVRSLATTAMAALAAKLVKQHDDEDEPALGRLGSSRVSRDDRHDRPYS